MYHTQRSETIIDGTPEEIWEFSSNPANWTASNPTEHWGLSYDSPDDRPGEGVEFHQDEAVAGIRNDLYGRFQYLDVPNVAVWTGTAYYPLPGGLFTLRIPEGGTIELEETEDGRTRMSHAIFMDFPNSRVGRWFEWVFEHVLDGPEKLAQHNQVELEYFKEQIESRRERETVPARGVLASGEGTLLRGRFLGWLIWSVVETVNRGRRFGRVCEVGLPPNLVRSSATRIG